MGFRAFLLAFLLIFVSGFLLFFWQDVFGKNQNQPVDIIRQLIDAPFTTLDQSSVVSETRQDCHHFNCFDVYRCGSHHKKVLVHIPDPVRLLDPQSQSEISPFTRQFVDILESVVDSGYYTSDPTQACVFVPAFSVLSSESSDSQVIGRALKQSSQYWTQVGDEGQNHLLFSFNKRSLLTIPHGKTMVAASSLNSFEYRHGFDISLPPLAVSKCQQEALFSQNQRQFLAATNSKKLNLSSSIQQFSCPTSLLNDAHFCLIFRDNYDLLIDSMRSGCIPVVVIDSLVLPFSEVLDWKRFSVRIHEQDKGSTVEILSQVSTKRVTELRKQLMLVYNAYFKDLKAITQTTLKILNDRVFSHHSNTYRDWNVLPNVRPPLFLRHTPPNEDGFTAVILTYDRIESLFNVINSVAATPSLTHIVVVWNNQEKPPPPPNSWPKTGKPLKVIQTHQNVLSNRFYPYHEIPTEAILSMDDDIVMLTPDELEFGYQVWREFPDRLVGFPSRTHVWNNVTSKWRYESEWTSDVSMVLTGAAFYHKYWNYLFTAAPSQQAKDIKAWVDHRMNCEDIAMNFMIANATGKAPIKVTPRKKFKCSTPQCTNVDMLSGVQSHMVERSDCINMLAEKYGYMPLKSAEFRADPVLYKDNFPDKLKKYANVGSL